MRRESLLAGALLLGVFLLGAAAGVGVDRAMGRGPPPPAAPPPHALPPLPRPDGPQDGPPRGPPWEGLVRDLDLDERQAAEVRAAFDEARVVVDGVRARTRPEVDAAVGRAEARVRAVLTEPQRARFEALRRDRPMGPPGFGGPPPMPPPMPPPPR